MAEPSEVDKILSAALLADANAHESGNYDCIAERYDAVEGEILPLQDVQTRRVAIAFNFWDSWCDARNHNWQYYPEIGKSDWPRLARHIAGLLEQGKDATDQVVIKKFAPENLPSVAARIAGWIRGAWITRKIVLGAFAMALAYIGSYAWFRQSHMEIWSQNGQPYVIFPKGSPVLYYGFRPLSYVDAKTTGMGFHIGEHQ